jgi:hypothetical protein
MDFLYLLLIILIILIIFKDRLYFYNEIISFNQTYTILLFILLIIYEIYRNKNDNEQFSKLKLKLINNKSILNIPPELNCLSNQNCY